MFPFILKQEQKQIQEEIKNKDVSVTFDGTSRLGEALAIVLSFIEENWNVEQRLVRLQMLAKSLCGEEIARVVISCLSITYGIGTEHVIGAMRDRASSNNVAMATMKVLYPFIVDIGCYSHTLDRVGEHFKTPTLGEFVSLWISLFLHSPKTRLMWKEQTSKSMASYSATRWWSQYEVMDQLLVQFGDVEPFLSKEDLGSNNTRKKLLTLLKDPQKAVLLQLELAAVVDWGVHFVKATYALEGDDVLDCFDIVETVRAAIRTAHIPNIKACVRRLCAAASDAKVEKKLIDYANGCIEPASKQHSHLTSLVHMPCSKKQDFSLLTK